MSLNTPGFIKFWIQNDLVETKYQKINEIPIMDINRQQTYINITQQHQNNSKNKSTTKNQQLQNSVVIVHCKQSSKCQEVGQRLYSNNIAKDRVILIPQQNSNEQFDVIKRNCQDCRGKMVVNGTHSHPLMKFLKKNSLDDFYDFNTNSSKKPIRGNIGIFVHHLTTLKTDYYNQDKIDSLFETINVNQKINNSNIKNVKK